ncbi:MAG: hypothetical protein R3C14_54370 [Caldilineaceae bacterium]
MFYPLFKNRLHDMRAWLTGEIVVPVELAIAGAVVGGVSVGALLALLLAVGGAR